MHTQVWLNIPQREDIRMLFITSEHSYCLLILDIELITVSFIRNDLCQNHHQPISGFITYLQGRTEKLFHMSSVFRTQSALHLTRARTNCPMEILTL